MLGHEVEHPAGQLVVVGFQPRRHDRQLGGLPHQRFHRARRPQDDNVIRTDFVGRPGDASVADTAERHHVSVVLLEHRAAIDLFAAKIRRSTDPELS